MANTDSDLGKLRGKADRSTAKAGDAMGDYADTKAGANDKVGDAAQSAVAAQAQAHYDQAQVDRLENHTRNQSVAAEDLPGNRPHGVVGDAWGGTAAEREQVADLKEKAKG